MKTKVLNLFLIMTLISMYSFSQDITDGLVTYLDMETSINDVDPNPVDQPPMDMSGLGNHPTNRGANPKGFNYQVIPNKDGFIFNRVMISEHNIPGHLLTEPGTFNRGKGDYSIAFWVYVKDADITDINGDLVEGHRDFQFLSYNNGPAETQVSPNTTTLAFLKNQCFAALTTNPNDYIVSPTPIEWEKWYHYAVVSEYATNTTKLYINGRLTVEKTIPNEDVIELKETKGGILLRRGGGGNLYYYDNLPEGLDSLPVNATLTVPTQRVIFDGMMDEFRLYNRTISESEIIEIMKVNYAAADIENTFDSNYRVYKNDYGVVVESQIPAIVTIYNSTGSIVLNKKIDSGNQVIPLNHYGSYLISINGRVHKFIY